MRTFSRWVALAVLVGGPAAYADRNDIELSRLGDPGTNADSAPNTQFRAVARTLGAVVSSTSLTPPETLGHAGFAVGMELGVVSLPSQVVLPTARDPNSTQQDGSVLVPSVHVRKGLPFSLDLGARVGWLDRSSLFAATGELKWAVNEGYIAWLPDIGLRAHVTHLLNTRDLHLTTGGLDVSVGKRFPLGGMVTLTPYGGIDFTGVMARAEPLSFQPGATVDKPTSTYAPVVGMQNVNTRFHAGGRFIGGALQLGAEVSASTVGTVTTPTGSETPMVLAFNALLGLDF